MNKRIVLFDIDYTLFDTDAFKQSNLQNHSLYDETYEVLNRVSKIAKLGIFSSGELEFQKNKLDKTKIRKYFSNEDTHISTDKETEIESILDNYKGDFVFLVDDKLPILHKAKSIAPSVFTVWIKRGMYANAQEPIPNFSPDAIIENLQDLIPLVQTRE